MPLCQYICWVLASSRGKWGSWLAGHFPSVARHIVVNDDELWVLSLGTLSLRTLFSPLPQHTSWLWPSAACHCHTSYSFLFFLNSWKRCTKVAPRWSKMGGVGGNVAPGAGSSRQRKNIPTDQQGAHVHVTWEFSKAAYIWTLLVKNPPQWLWHSTSKRKVALCLLPAFAPRFLQHGSSSSGFEYLPSRRGRIL